jgi:FtsP/CotA-like multicopper oxidase with cupredoxin domain
LLLAKVGNTSYPYDPQWNVYNFGSNSSVRLVLRNMAPLVHPIHLHGHNFWILAEGVGSWNGSVNNSNPQRRDTQLLPPGNPTNPSYLVIEYVANNPGVWPLHCHIAW